MAKQKDLTLYIQNVRSLNNKLSYLRSNIGLLSVLPDIIVFTETWLKPETDSSSLGLFSYNIYRSDRASRNDQQPRGGGVLVAVHQSISSHLVDKPVGQTEDSLESLFVEVHANNNKLLIAAVYIPSFLQVQMYKDFMNCLEELSVNFSKNEIVVCGDFNLPNIQWSSVTSQYVVQQYTNPRIIEAADVLQQTATLMDWVQLFPVHSLKGYTLDLLFSSPETCQQLQINEDLLVADPAHHESSFFVLKNFGRSKFSESENKPLKNYYRANYELINSQLDIDWDSILEGTVNESVDYFYKIVNDVIEKNVPNLKSSPSQYPHWYNLELKQLIIEKKCLHATYKESKRLHLPKQVNDYIQFSKIRASCLKLSRELYAKYIAETEGRIRHQVKSFWSFVHKFTKGNTLPDKMFLRDRSAEGKRSICNLLADHFSSVYRSINLQVIEEISLNDLLISYQVEESELLLAMLKLDDNVKSGPDALPPYFLRRCRPTLIKPILLLFNKSLAAGIFPTFWKQSYIFPIFKSGQKSNAANYRPISILSTLPKLFESIIASRLSDYLFSKIGPYQHGFMKGRSVLTNLLLYNDYLFSAFQNNQQVDSVYIDFSKAFDTVNHERLLQKVWNAGVRGTLHRWLRSYLTDRRQTVRSCGSESYSFPTPSGVPQGSNLGPLLFTIFINDLPTCLRSSRLLKYADDAKLFLAVASREDTIMLQSDLDRFHAWSMRNGLSINFEKSKLITFSRGTRIFEVNYSIDSKILDRVQTIRDLGVIYDSALSFDQQTESVVTKCLKILGFIRNVTLDFRNVSTLVYLYKSLLLPILTYSSSVWFPQTATDFDQLISIEHKFLRFASRKTQKPMHYFDHEYTEIRKALGITELRKLFKRFDCIVSYKINNRLFSSSKMNELFEQRSISYFLRNPRPITQQVPRRNYIEQSSTFRLKSQWNSLSSEIRQSSSLPIFKTKISSLFQ